MLDHLHPNQAIKMTASSCHNNSANSHNFVHTFRNIIQELEKGSCTDRAAYCHSWYPTFNAERQQNVQELVLNSKIMIAHSIQLQCQIIRQPCWNLWIYMPKKFWMIVQEHQWRFRSCIHVIVQVSLTIRGLLNLPCLRVLFWIRIFNSLLPVSIRIKLN